MIYLKKIKCIYFINKYKIFLYFFLFFCNKVVFSQNNEEGFPLIQNITPKEYGHESQNYSIIQDERGVIYVGNLSGILEYDGNFWKLIKIKGSPRLTIDNNQKIYAAGYDDFGYLSPNKKNQMSFIPLINKNDKKTKYFGQVQDIESYYDLIFFSADNKLFKWDNISLEVIDSSETSYRIFKINFTGHNEIYFYKDESGLLRYSKGNLITVTKGDFFSKKNIVEILPYDKENLLIKTKSSKGFYIFNSNEIKPFKTQIDDFIESNILNEGCLLSNDYYAFGTSRGGLLVIDKSGKLVCNLNKQNGLYDDNVTGLYLDKLNNLWLTLSNGISRIEIPSAFSFFDSNLGFKGGILSITRNKGLIYIATTQGVFYLSGNYTYNEKSDYFNSPNFVQVKGIYEKCNLLCPYKNMLLAACDNGLYEINKGTAEKIFSGNYITIYPSNYNKSILYLGRKNGLSVAEYKDEKWKDLGSFKKIHESIKSLTETKNGTLWIGSRYHGLFKAEISKFLKNNLKIVEYVAGQGLPLYYDWIYICQTSNGLLFLTSEGIYKINDKTNKFYRDTLINFETKTSNRWIYPVVEDNYKNIWFSSGLKNSFDKMTAIAFYKGKDRKYVLSSLPFKRIKNFTVETIFIDKSNIVWLGGFDGLIRFDIKKYKNDTGKYYTLIRNIIIGKDSIVYYGNNINRFGFENIFSNDTLIPQLTYKYNSIHFEFCTPYYKNNYEVLYQYCLEGFNNEWSEWTEENIKEFTNLSEGKYVFKVRSKNIYGKISEPAIYKFIILPPFYRTWGAYLFYIVLITSFVLMIIKWRSYHFAEEKYHLEKILAERTEELVKQKERAEELVANILPKDTAEELQSLGHVTRKKYKMVTVLFADVQGFTKIAEYMNPEFLLDELDKYIYEFDNVVEKFGIEKIKTIGDAYMCAGGIPRKNGTNPIDVVMAALEMQKFMYNLRLQSQNKWDIRIGIHSGPVIAGVVGTKKMTYDIWGDTVNIANRMESSGEPGQINISEFTHELVQEFFDFEYRGKIPVKYKGEVDMYFVNGIKKELSIDEQGLQPNDLFYTKLQLLRYDDLEELIMTKFEKGLPKNLYYHNMKHTIDVCVEAEIIGRIENINDEEMLILKTACLLHDTGFLIGYEDHELLGIKMAKNILPDFHYSEEQIKVICDLIYSTNKISSPSSKLEKIICDADLSYLGREDFIPVSQNLFRELFERGKISTMNDWNKMQLKFFDKHEYYTEAAKQMRNEIKKKHLEELKKVV